MELTLDTKRQLLKAITCEPIDGEMLFTALSVLVSEVADNVSDDDVDLFDSIVSILDAYDESEGDEDDVDLFEMKSLAERALCSSFNAFILFGRSLSEWEREYGEEEDFWDFSLDDVIEGAIELVEGTEYWYINGRLYEA